MKRDIAPFLAATIFSSLAQGQAFLGHEYELDAAPLREGEEAVIPRIRRSPALTSGANCAI